MSDKLENMLIRHEGLRLKPYRCTAGKLSIGVGRNLDDVGITDAEARMMLNYDIQSRKVIFSKFKWYTLLNEARQDVIIDMSFMGVAKLLTFKKLINALEDQDYNAAANEMAESKWAKQVGDRAVELIAMMIKGKYLN